jgi:hypothetical protein
VTGFHRREPAPGPLHRCAAGANDCGPRTHAFRRDCTEQTTLSRPGMAAGSGMGTHHSRGIRPESEPYAVRRTGGVAAGAAQNRGILALDGRSAPGLVGAGHRRAPDLRCHAQRRSPSPAAWAAGVPPHAAVPDEPGRRAAGHHGGRDGLLGRAWNPRRLAAWQGMLDHSLLGRAGRARAYRNWRRALAETGQMQQGDGRNLGGT